MADWNELDLGGVDAYAAAVKAGYTGTRQEWMAAMQNAEANGLKAEGYANGKQNGTAVESGTYFHDNAQYYKELAEAAKIAAQAAQAAAETAAETDLVAWLQQNITNPDSPPLDRTLASSSSAAPADMVGDLKSALSNEIELSASSLLNVLGMTDSGTVTIVRGLRQKALSFYIIQGNTYTVSITLENQLNQSLYTFVLNGETTVASKTLGSGTTSGSITFTADSSMLVTFEYLTNDTANTLISYSIATQKSLSSSIDDLKDKDEFFDEVLYSKVKVIDVSNVASGGQAYPFKKGEAYRAIVTSTNTTQYQIGTVESGSYVDQLTDVESGNADLTIDFVASGDASQFYVYLTGSGAKYSLVLYKLNYRFVDDETWIEKTNDFSTVIRNSFLEASDMWGIADATITENGLSMSAGGSAFHRMPLAFDDYVFSATFKLLSATAVVGIATEGSWKSKITIDASDNYLRIYTNANDGQTLSVAKSVLLTGALANNRFYRLELHRNGWDYHVKVVDEANNVAICNYKYANFAGTTTRAYSRFNGYFGVVCDTESALCNDLSVRINHKKCKCLIVGDSLTEGDQVENSKRWAYLLKTKYFDGDAVIAGAGGDSTTAIKTRLQKYIDLGITFDMCIVLGGMNNRTSGGYASFTADMDNIVQMILNANAVPVIAVNPIPGSGADYIHEQRGYIVSKGWNTIRFDYAFSHSYAYNSAYFNTDGIHPNAEGDQVMYEAAVEGLNNLFLMN